ncbi:hypothetical protein RRG08_067064 [Elysia crispata]|uniref:Uncharacterized protein n=1 Tax=Elysia crispata TaxID=231223 RepID=A0AAE1B9G5_9GAST|nr:hypothetical protein RRG08_067064 [Elysia crispata]
MAARWDLTDPQNKVKRQIGRRASRNSLNSVKLLPEQREAVQPICLWSSESRESREAVLPICLRSSEKNIEDSHAMERRALRHCI